MKKRLWKSIALILTVAILITSLPLAIIVGALQPEEALAAETQASSIVEMIELRTEDTKTFRLEDGSYYLAQYDTAVHRLDENGLWQDIDNTLSVSGDEVVTGDAKIKFSKKITGSEKLFTVHDGDRKLTLSLNGAEKKVKAQIENKDSTLSDESSALEKMTTLSKVSASVTYEDILENTDLKYIVSGNHIKEYIIVKEQAQAYSYSFTMSLNGLAAVMNEDGGVSVQDALSGQTIYTIPAPVMWDAAGETSDRAEISLTTVENGEYMLTVTADTAWVNASERVFPVTIDPPIFSSGASSTVDLTVSVSNTTYNDSTSDTLTVDGDKRIYWKKSTLPNLPRTAYIVDAFFVMQALMPSQPITANVAVYDVTSAWDSSLTYGDINHQGQIAEYYTDAETFVYSEVSAGFIDGTTYPRWTVTPIVKKWYEGQNYGLALAPTPNEPFEGSIRFYSSDSQIAVARPYLCISYVDMKGLEDYWSYTSQSAGFAGSGAINNATGSLSFAIPTLTTTDSLMPFTPTLVYHSSMAGLPYTYGNAQVGIPTLDTPYGFKWNMQETLIKKNIGEDPWYILSDADGTEHYFAWIGQLDSSTHVYRDEDGLQLVLSEYSGYCKIEDADFNVRTYTQVTAPSGTEGAYVLTGIRDKSGNELCFEYGTYSGGTHIRSISLCPNGGEKIEQLRIEYISHGVPYVIWNPTTSEGVVFRYSDTPKGAVAASAGKYLRQVIRVHGGADNSAWLNFYNTNACVSSGSVIVDGVAEYAYRSNCQLSEIHNLLSQYTVGYGVLNNKVIAVSESATGSDEPTAGQTITFSYGTSSTVVQTSGSDDIIDTSDDLLTTYGFDAEGRTVSCYTTDVTRTVLYGASSGEYTGIRDGGNSNAKNNIKSAVQTDAHSSNYLLNGSFETASGTRSTQYWTTAGLVSTIVNTESGGAWNGIGNRTSYAAHLRTDGTTAYSSISQTVYLDAGEYTLSFYAKGMPSETPVTVELISGENTTHSVTKRIASEDIYEGGSYVFFSVPFRAEPTTAGSKECFTVRFAINGRYAEFTIDHVMLSKTLGESGYDALKMGHFEQSHATVFPTSVWQSRTGSVYAPEYSIVDSGVPAFGDVLSLGSGNAHRAVEQTVFEGSSTQPISITLSDFGKCESANATKGFFRLEIVVKYANLTDPVVTEIPFDPSITDWQFVSGSVKTETGKGAVTSIKIAVFAYKNASNCYVDNLACYLNDNNAAYYDYTDSGKLYIAETAEEKIWNIYNLLDMVYRSVSSDGMIIEYTYDNCCRPYQVITYRYWDTISGDLVQLEAEVEDVEKTRISAKSYIYNEYGQVTNENEMGLSNQNIYDYQIIRTYYTNPNYFGALATENNVQGQTTTYFYNNKAQTQAVMYPDGTGVYYTYDGMGNLTGVEEGSFSTGTPTAQTNGTGVSYTYDTTTKRLSTIVTESSTYSFTYDLFGNTENISVGDRTLASYTYHEGNGKLETLTYGNGDKVKYLYDALDRVKEICYNTGEDGAYETAYSYEYTASGALAKAHDHRAGETTAYAYDLTGKLIGSYTYETATGTVGFREDLTYDNEDRIVKSSQAFPYYFHDYDIDFDNVVNHSITRTFTYDGQTGDLVSSTLTAHNLSGTSTLTYDNLHRLLTRNATYTIGSTTAMTFAEEYEYTDLDGLYRSSPQIREYTTTLTAGSTTVSHTYEYTYDANGNISSIIDEYGDSTDENYYTYDDLGQLIREDNYWSGETYVYTYDDAGNRTSAGYTIYSYGQDDLYLFGETTYTYTDSEWGDLLTSYGGNTLTYDEIGNLITLTESNGKVHRYTWEGRKLTSYQYESADAILKALSFTYNDEGIRTSKTVDGVVHEYILNGSTVIAERWKTSSYMEHILVYVYDENGAPIAIQYRHTNYPAWEYDVFFLEKNMFGDVIAIYNEAGERIGEYYYDAWGNASFYAESTNTALENNIVNNYNPFRYRGYFYDVETGLYYLQSRYYSLEMGRFINADGYVSTGQGLLGNNMFAYCNNNPVMYVDPNGDSSILALIGILGILMITLTSSEKQESAEQDQHVMDVVMDSVTIDLGVGAGLGDSVEVGGIEGTAMLREDFITYKKDAGESGAIGYASEEYGTIEGLDCNFPKGYKIFYDLDGNVIKKEELYPNFDGTFEVGLSIYLGLGFTAKIGFDYEYFLQECGR